MKSSMGRVGNSADSLFNPDAKSKNTFAKIFAMICRTEIFDEGTRSQKTAALIGRGTSASNSSTELCKHSVTILWQLIPTDQS